MSFFGFASANQTGVNFKRGVLEPEPVLSSKMDAKDVGPLTRAKLEYELVAMKTISKQGLERAPSGVPGT